MTVEFPREHRQRDDRDDRMKGADAAGGMGPGPPMTPKDLTVEGRAVGAGPGDRMEREPRLAALTMP